MDRPPCPECKMLKPLHRRWCSILQARKDALFTREEQAEHDRLLAIPTPPQGEWAPVPALPGDGGVGVAGNFREDFQGPWVLERFDEARGQRYLCRAGDDDSLPISSRQDCDDLIALLQQVRETLG